MSRPLPTHPFFHELGKVSVTNIREEVDRTDLELLAVDCYGTKRPEQAYRTVRRGQYTHLYTAVSHVGQFVGLQSNNDEVTREHKPYTLPLSTRKIKLYLNQKENHARLFHLVVKAKTGTLDKAELMPAKILVAPRYLAPPRWFLSEIAQTPEEDYESKSKLRHANGTRLLSTGEAHALQQGTFTDNTSDALYLLNAIPSILTGNFFQDQSIHAIFSYRNTTGIQSFSDQRIGPFPNAGVTAGVRRYSHRFNSYVLEETLNNRAGPNNATVREVVQGMRNWTINRRYA